LRKDLVNGNGIIFDIKKYAIHDGPGIRTTVFFKGCPLNCWWCHNPEGLDISAQVIYRKDRCIGCGECINVCPEGAIALSPSGVITDQSKCVHCGICVETCPAEARELVGKVVTVDHVVGEIKKDILLYDESGGGVTFSGGEPLMQPDFLLGLLDACGKLDIHRTVDTAGYADAELLLRVADRTELFLYDLKHMDSEKHRKYTGVPNEQILSNLESLAKHGANINIRIPIIPGINSDDENIERMGSFVSSLPGVHDISLLPYHSAAEAKYGKLGMEYRLGKTLPLSEDEMEAAAKRLEKFGSHVKIGG
jgi:pyruvate formate lyase activating enzyme